ncbi:MAG: LAGLIDADG family homing endonuclease [Candidatus Wildermuthbacteria bacterium]|nr:LAGLIDADG family homing endonuclease [Candidatus Wildermuthbacteria bacterium]
MGRQNQEKIDITWSSNFAYAIGLITSDGCVSKDQRHITFVSKDLELAEKFKKALALTNRFIMSGRGGETTKLYYTVRFGDKVFYQFLATIGLTSAKSKTIKSVMVPKYYFPDFLRGLFDGDGTFYTFWDKRWPNSFGFKLSFASASKDFIGWLKIELSRLYGVTGCFHKGAGVINLEYTKGDTKKLFNTMYYKTRLLFLNRKYRKIKTAFQMDERFGSVVLQKPRKAGLAHR